MAADESYPDELRYHPKHDWARTDGDVATLGITWYAQDQLGEIVYYEPPQKGASLTKDETYGGVESVKAFSEVFAPLSGEVVEVNSKAVEAPETINDDPYGDGWLFVIEPSDQSQVGELLDPDGYRALIEG